MINISVKIIDLCNKTMAELVSVQVHAPIVRDSHLELVAGQPTLTRLKKVENRSAAVAGGMTQNKSVQPRSIDIEFRDLSYTVSEGRRKGYLKLLSLSSCYH